MNETYKLIYENARYRAALDILKIWISKESDGRLLIDGQMMDELMEIAGVKDKEVNIISFDNCKDVAYEGN